VDEIKRSVIQPIIYQWLVDATGIEFIVANSSTDGPRPANTYGSFLISNFEETIINNVEYFQNLIDNDLDEVIRIFPIANISVNIFGNDAEDKILKLRVYPESTKSIEYLMYNKMGFAGMSNIRNLDILTHNTWEHRFQVDLRIGLSGQYINKVDPIESVKMTNELNGEEIQIP